MGETLDFHTLKAVLYYGTETERTLVRVVFAMKDRVDALEKELAKLRADQGPREEAGSETSSR